MIKVSDLKDQIGMSGPRPFLKCFVCGGEYSANKADYFMAYNPEHVFTCCDENMSLVTKREVFTEVPTA